MSATDSATTAPEQPPQVVESSEVVRTEEEVKTSSSDVFLLPVLPSRVLDERGLNWQRELDEERLELEAALDGEEWSSPEFTSRNRAVVSSSIELLDQLRNGLMEGVDEGITRCDAWLETLLKLIGDDIVLRDSRLGQTIERATTVRIFRSFFLTGRLLTREETPFANDEEYLGAAINFANELTRYSINRACESDLQSIGICRRLVAELNSALLEFDFRNGPLRRRYDSVKYAVKTLENTTLELGLALERSQLLSATNEEPEMKRQCHGDEGSSSTDAWDEANTPALVDMESFKVIAERLAKYDAQRESVIKASREVQKLSKQAVYSIIRGQLKDADLKLTTAKKAADEIFVTVKEFPTLRPGAFSNSLEEWAEGRLLYIWVTEKRIGRRRDLGIDVTPVEYVGGLSDLSGELGRLAVAHASRRDEAAVKDILQADIVIHRLIQQLNQAGGNAAVAALNGGTVVASGGSMTGRFSKKLDAVVTNTRKIEEVIYELRLLTLTGRRVRISTPEAPPTNEE